MKNRLLFILTVGIFLFSACGDPEPEEQTNEEVLFEVKNGVYTEYYPGRKAIKYQGPQDENEMRNGRWFFYSETGVELSMTEYKHGKKDGDSFVRYPNGMMRYYGHYTNDEQTGVWITYDEKGNVSQEKDFGTPDE
jgi:antitoxin component YwqK of YwqJK toxin-antitoxin module